MQLWINLDDLKAPKRKVGNRIRLSDSDFSNLIHKLSNVMFFKPLTGFDPSVLCLAGTKTAVDELCKGATAAKALPAMTGVSQTLPRYAVLFGCMFFKFFQAIVYSLVELLAYLLNYSSWIAVNQRQAHDI